MAALRALDAQRYFSWMRPASSIDPKLHPTATFIYNIAIFVENNRDNLDFKSTLLRNMSNIGVFIEINNDNLNFQRALLKKLGIKTIAKTDNDNPEFQKSLLIQLKTEAIEIAFQRVITGAMLLSAIDIIPTPESTIPATCPLATHLLNALRINSHFEFDEVEAFHCFNALGQLILATPDKKWHPEIDNAQLLDSVKYHLQKANSDWVDLGVQEAETEASALKI